MTNEEKDLIKSTIEYSISFMVSNDKERDMLKKFLENFDNLVQLKEVQKLAKVAEIYNVDRRVLDYRLKYLKEGEEYIKLGERQPTILTPKGVEKIINIKNVKL